ncbi:MAG: hypothetical protein HZA77_05985 [Candidatus Schekmanbacteria bacterium]|nr:hypothetical protein [Candidatus Schekmanbacteria bacterium]
MNEKNYGWTGTIIRADLSSGAVSKHKTPDYKNKFIGGRALASRIYWDEVPKGISAFSPDNLLMILPGPLTGSHATACSRWVISAKSPFNYPDQFGFGNAGGFVGAALKLAGYDGLLINGKAEKPSYIFIENDKVEIKDASGLWRLTSDETLKKLKEAHGNLARAVCIGPAGENKIRFALAITDQGGTISNGMGAVLGSKNLKAIVVKGNNSIAVANPERLKELNNRIRFLRKGLNEMPYMTEPSVAITDIEKNKNTPCFGCPAGCMRATFKHTSGLEEVRKTCAAAFYYAPWDVLHNGQSTDAPFFATSLADRYGLCTGELSNIMWWLDAAFKEGIISEEEMGIPISKIGSLEFIQTLVYSIAYRKGFGDLLAEGTRRASIEKGKKAEELALKRVMPSGYVNDSYGGRIFLMNTLFYATEIRNPIIQLHEVHYLLLKWIFWYTTNGAMSPVNADVLRKIAKRVWGSEESVDFSTYDGKALAAFRIQNAEHAKETMVACDRYFPLLDTDQVEDSMGDPAFVPNLFSAVTGKEMSEDEFYLLGERSFNMQRAIHGREGKSGRESDTIPEFNFTEPVETVEGVLAMFNPDIEFPGPGDQIVSRKGKTVDRAEFERMKDEYYLLRSWDVKSGLQKKEKLTELGLSDISSELEKMGILK